MLDSTADMVSAQAAADITVVNSARELQAAISDGAQDIVIRNHLDFSKLPLAFDGEATRAHTVLPDVNANTRSIRVRFRQGIYTTHHHYCW